MSLFVGQWDSSVAWRGAEARGHGGGGGRAAPGRGVGRGF